MLPNEIKMKENKLERVFVGLIMSERVWPGYYEGGGGNCMGWGKRLKYGKK